MPLRILEVTVAKESLARVSEVLDEASIVQSWTVQETEHSGWIRVLVQAESAEALSDEFVERFGNDEGFRVVLLSVEATIPAVGSSSTGEDTETDKGEAEDGEKGERPGPRRIGRAELYEDIAQASQRTGTYVVMVALSTVVAAVGLTRGDVAIVIGAMVIAPLLGPNMALSLACTLGDLDLAKRSLRAIGIGVSTAFVTSVVLGTVLVVDPGAREIAARTGAGVGDIFLALAAGAAGSLAFTSGVPAVLVGVMVAVALLPPLVVAGLLVGAGYVGPALNAMTLVLTNVACVNLAAVATFLIQEVRPRTWWEEDRAEKATRVAVATWLFMLTVLVGLIVFGQVRGD